MSTHCAAAFPSATDYSGEVRTSRVAPAELILLAAVPADAVLLGWVRAKCTLRTEATEEGVWLSDLDCSKVRLTRALVERAAEVGADFAAQRECERDGEHLECSVLVGVSVAVSRETQRAELDPRSGASGQTAVPNLLGLEGLDRNAWLDEPDPHLAWRMRVRFTPRGDLSKRSVKAASETLLVEHRSVDRAHLGDLTLDCEGGCTKAAMVEGVRVAARRLGADEAAEIRCGRAGSGQLCVAELGVARDP
jgi:hypothetical protein